ncbi:MAG: YihA family ribosome biogenesis GTP-binding protein [Bacteroidales bacterium]|jgi:GTP-binding protein|nr:YihA family ribosome biogenesis GTP-binding protein [Bacteroidales bacterium]MBO7529425.1 YihA family ribosome biogenesis GTP-binding protein [Bacteroidales bacterium]MBQ3844948.1 YihA family ribosome biogenesis GTP-binding protein [Bacteroidales bacterium]
MIIKSASFLQSNTNVNKLPKPDKPEYAFIGRSNVGKSSLINMLTGNSKLAKVSSTPGKTITINHFIINNEWYLVDLPGYGFAKRSQKDREMWKKMLDAYILGRPNLVMTFVLVDSRIKPQKIDLDFISSLGENQVPFAIIFTKADKLGSGQLSANIEVYKNELLKEWEELPTMIVTSSEKKIGRDNVLDLIEFYNKEFTK